METLTKADFDFILDTIKNSSFHWYSAAGTPENGMPCFQRLDPGSREQVYECVMLLDVSYSTHLNSGGRDSIRNMTQQILSCAPTFHRLKAGERLSDDELDALVKAIAPTPRSGKRPRINFSFATKFCAQIAPTVCPIYDRIVAELLGSWLGRGRRRSMECLRTKADYKDFLKVYRSFQVAHAPDLTFRMIDWILWWTGSDRSDALKDRTEEEKARFREIAVKVRRICRVEA